MNMPPHGFTIDKFISNEDVDAHCLVLRRGPRVVVAFRGSSSRKYVATSFRVPLHTFAGATLSTCCVLPHRLAPIATACSPRNARTDMRFQRGYADFRERSRHALDVVSQVPGLRNLLPLVHQASLHP